jgi:general secretion pathway protein B
MSFILDALRKSEHDRQRQTGPALVDAPVAAPKPATNRWATAAIALLVVNLVAIGVLLLVRSNKEPAAAAPGTEQAAAAPTTATPSPQASITQTLPEPQVGPAPPPPAPRAAPTTAPVAATRNSLEQEMSGYAPTTEAAAAAATPPPGPPAVRATRPGTVVYESLPEAAPSPAYGAIDSATRNLPRADEMAARGSLPELRLELHVWSTKPQERFVFVNGRRYREGDATAEGATVEQITQDGVIMNAGGNRFLLSRD